MARGEPSRAEGHAPIGLVNGINIVAAACVCLTLLVSESDRLYRPPYSSSLPPLCTFYGDEGQLACRPHTHKRTRRVSTHRLTHTHTQYLQNTCHSVAVTHPHAVRPRCKTVVISFRCDSLNGQNRRTESVMAANCGTTRHCLSSGMDAQYCSAVRVRSLGQSV